MIRGFIKRQELMMDQWLSEEMLLVKLGRELFRQVKANQLVLADLGLPPEQSLRMALAQVESQQVLTLEHLQKAQELLGPHPVLKKDLPQP
jgi:antitoxin component of RelBE/YafQ-DinJ toxin-antitoxin module